MKAMILAAGFGTRLFPLTADRTKPALPFLGKPLVGYVAEYLSKFGFDEVIVNLHYQPESVKAALGDGKQFGVKIHYSLENPHILGTAGALWNARDWLQDKTFLVINGKIVTDIDLAAALETHRQSGALATMVLKENTKHEKFTIINTENNFVTNFGAYPAPLAADEIQNPKSKIQNPLMYTGIQILEPAVFDYIPADVESDIISVFYRPALAGGLPIAAYVASGDWYELSTISRYLDISLAMLEKTGSNVFIGENCQIAENVNLRDSILWNNVVVKTGARIFRCVIGDGVQINADEQIENAAIVQADLVRGREIPAKSIKGFFAGDNYVVPPN